MRDPPERPTPVGDSSASPLQMYLNRTYELARPRIRVCYRGHGNSAWKLHSGAVRRLLHKLAISAPEEYSNFASHYIDYHYNTLLTPARQRGFHIDAGVQLSDLQLLAKLQHFGAATGLLDFTLSPLVALWFACQEAGMDGTVFVLDVTPSMNDTLTWGECISILLLFSLQLPEKLFRPDPLGTCSLRRSKPSHHRAAKPLSAHEPPGPFVSAGRYHTGSLRREVRTLAPTQRSWCWRRDTVLGCPRFCKSQFTPPRPCGTAVRVR